MGSPSTRDGDRVFILNKHGRIMKSVEESSLKLGRKNSKEARFKHYIDFYNLVKLGFDNFLPPNVNQPADVLWWLWDHFEKEKLIRFMGFTWLIWLRRNNFIFNKKHPPDQIWLEWAVEIIEQQLGLHQQLQTTALSKPNAWFPPPLDVLLINTDATLKPGEWGCGLSAVIRNYAGELMVAEVVYIHGCLSVQMAEATAINLGIQLALRRSIQKARVGSDCQSIIKALNSNLNVPTDWGQMVRKEGK
ncbi:hypothetical protein G4B88_019825 [Cannabis sativa]|uniref:RNase H type-1 domain-containing protein n=1 Tax=Cannabis sativa TaxID=3483 RepID=A0A7J6HS48_CANSA|nr:hypothetical protein G4B88_019825 [Cannabis sativa]